MRLCQKWTLGLAVFVTGCGGSKNHAELGAKTPEAYESARSSFQSKSYSQAIEQATTALEQGGGSADQQAELLMIRAKARVEVGQLTEAIADVDKVLTIDDSPSHWAARGSIHLKAGNQALAKADFAKAKSLDPKIAIPAEAK